VKIEHKVLYENAREKRNVNNTLKTVVRRVCLIAIDPLAVFGSIRGGNRCTIGLREKRRFDNELSDATRAEIGHMRTLMLTKLINARGRSSWSRGVISVGNGNHERRTIGKRSSLVLSGNVEPIGNPESHTIDPILIIESGKLTVVRELSQVKRDSGGCIARRARSKSQRIKLTLSTEMVNDGRANRTC